MATSQLSICALQRSEIGSQQLLRLATVVAALCVTSAKAAEPATPQRPLKWESLPSIPDPNGFASPFAGVCGDSLIVGGGSNFPEKKLWEGGSKQWYDSVFALDKSGSAWKKVGKLPRPIAGGVSVSTADGIACLGGGDANKCYADCFLLVYRDGNLAFTPLPELPSPCTNAAGVLLDHTIYVAGGIDLPDATRALNTFWSLDLNNLAAGWEKLESWPGPGRMLATIGTQGGSVYLFSGTDLKLGSVGKPERAWLKDAYRFTPGRNWQRIADLPRVAVAAPTPAPPLNPSHLLLLGGDDGKQAKLPPQTHKGFSRDVLSYDTATDQWHTLGDLPFSLVTTPSVNWNNLLVIPGGEEHPGIRSNKVWAAKILSQ